MKITKTEELFENAQIADSIMNLDDYYRYMRIKQYKKLVGNDCGTSEDKVITIKGDVLKYVNDNNISVEYGHTMFSSANKARNNANSVPLLRTATLLGLCGGYVKITIMNLPLKLCIKARVYYFAPINTGVLKRPAEKEAVVRNLKAMQKNPEGNYHPLCLYSVSDYVLDTYMNGIAKCMLNTTTEVINAAELTADDMYGGLNNIFVRRCKNDGVSLFLIDMRGGANEAVRREILKFTSYEYRKRFRLCDVGVDVDLSAAVPIIFCNSEAELCFFKKCCDVVVAEKLTNTEKAEAISEVVYKEEQKYGVKFEPFGREAYGELITLPLQEIEKIVDRAIRENTLYGKVKITDNLIKEYSSYMQCESIEKIGFGDKNEKFK